MAAAMAARGRVRRSCSIRIWGSSGPGAGAGSTANAGHPPRVVGAQRPRCPLVGPEVGAGKARDTVAGGEQQVERRGGDAERGLPPPLGGQPALSVSGERAQSVGARRAIAYAAVLMREVMT